MIWSVYYLRVTKYSLSSDSWDTWNLKLYLAYLGMISGSSVNLLSWFIFSQMQGWYVPCLVPWSFNRLAKFSPSNVVSCPMKESTRVLGGCLSLLDPCKIYGTKGVRFLVSLGTVAVFIVFIISPYISCFPFYPYSNICRWVHIEDI